jgi:hypothetical protein
VQEVSIDVVCSHKNLKREYFGEKHNVSEHFVYQLCKIKTSNINGPDLDEELVMNVTTPLLPHADMRSSESNALQEGADVQRYEVADNWTDAVIAVTPPEGFTTQVIPNMCCR